ncbi:MAG: DUF3300 domain-containing protein [Desulfuromonadales bacterium]|nr:DUF3300 domain-containing protein [Desulfuromonadales bacterium]
MKKFLLTLHAVLLALGLFSGQMARAESDQYVPPDAMVQENDTPFTPEELDELLAPIALYPDPLLAQILPAATFVDQIDLATRYVRQYGNVARIDDQSWDVSVKAVAHYPDVLFMMDQKYDWTVSLGQAYGSQPQDVMDAIQRLRVEALDDGNLVSTPEQQVTDEGGLISIDPIKPDLIYVPQYDPLTVYIEGPSPEYGFITFGAGFMIGAWLNRDCDWHGRRIFYHGWQGGGWISRARPRIQVRNSVYISNRFSAIDINRKTIQHDTERYRGEIRRNVQLHRERAVNTPHPAKVEQSVPAATGRSQQARPDATNLYRGRDIRKSQPASQTGYGGYGSSKDASTYRERGQSSRGNMQQSTRPVPAQRPAVSGARPLQRPSTQLAPRQAPSGGERRQR